MRKLASRIVLILIAASTLIVFQNCSGTGSPVASSNSATSAQSSVNNASSDSFGSPAGFSGIQLADATTGTCPTNAVNLDGICFIPADSSSSEIVSQLHPNAHLFGLNTGIDNIGCPKGFTVVTGNSGFSICYTMVEAKNATQILTAIVRLPAGGNCGTDVVPVPSNSIIYQTLLSDKSGNLCAMTSQTIPTMTVPAQSTSGASITVTVANGPGNSTDWIGMYADGAQPVAANLIAWQYLNSSHTAPATGLHSASVTFTLPATPKQVYYFTLNAGNSYTVIARSSSTAAW